MFLFWSPELEVFLFWQTQVGDTGGRFWSSDHVGISGVGRLNRMETRDSSTKSAADLTAARRCWRS